MSDETTVAADTPKPYVILERVHVGRPVVTDPGVPFRKASDVCLFCNTTDDVLREERTAIRNRIRIHDQEGSMEWKHNISPTIAGELRHAGYTITERSVALGVIISWTGK